MALLAAFVVSLVSADLAAAGFRSQGTGTMASDGLSWVAIERPDGTTTLIDTRTGSRRTVTPPARCARESSSGHYSTGLSATGPDAVVWHCNPDQPEYRHVGEPLIYVISSGEFIRPGGVAASWNLLAQRSASEVNLTITGVGHHWIRTTSVGYHWHDDTLWSIATGSSKRADEGGPGANPDVNAASGFRTLCRPLQRQKVPMDTYDAGPTYASYWGYESPYGLTFRNGLVLDRCGTSRSRRLSKPGDFGGSAQLAGRVVTWSALGARAMVHSVRTRRTHSYRFRGAESVQVAHTRTHVLVRTYPQGEVFIRRMPK